VSTAERNKDDEIKLQREIANAQEELAAERLKEKQVCSCALSV
jgi:hypothetical protein